MGEAPDYGSNLWYMLNGVGEADFVNTTSVASVEGDRSTGNE